MVDPKLLDYIKDCLSKDIPIEQIKKSLLEKGWKDYDINETINLINQQNPKQIYNPQSFNIMQEKSKTQNKFKLSKNLIFISAGIFVLLIAVLIIFLLMKSPVISEDNLSEGVYISLGEDKGVEFNMDSEKHTITASSISENSATITILSTVITATLDVGETKKFDFNDDAIFDLSVKLNNITDNKANLYLKKISETCSEDWNCTEWSNCTDGNQTRLCDDLNECGTETDKPEIVQGCEIIPPNCSDIGGYLCGSTETCNATLLNASDGTCCSEICIQPELEVISCGTDMDCLINASNDCHPANITYTFVSSNTTWRQNNTYYYKIRGMESDKCKLYQELRGASGNFTDSQWATLRAVPYTTDEIKQMIQQINGGLRVGGTGICRFSTYALNEYLTAIKEESYTLTSEDIATYGCTGTLFE